jgi:cell wall-associated NlpC family hydrolase
MRKTAGVLTLVIAGSMATMMGTVAPAVATPAAAQPTHIDKTALVRTALTFMGAPFTRTGTSPEKGFSDLGFVIYVYATQGVFLPSEYKSILASAPRVKRADLQPGDLVFFKNTVWPGLSHVGIYIGEGKFVHAEWFGYGVTVTSLKNDPRDGNYWAQHYKTANRP